MTMAISAIQGIILLSCLCTTHGAGYVRGIKANERNLQEFMLMDPLVNATAADPEHLYPLGRCQGDCDEDSHCMEGLKCYQREANTFVPGCRGGEQDGSGSDYCIRLEDFPKETTTTDPSPSPSTSPSSVPSSAPSSMPSSEPSSEPSNAPSSLPSSISALSWGELAVVSEPFSRPLALCEGDCDSDDDCAEGLICWMRNSGDEPVPYCEGPVGTSRTDYCVHDSAAFAAPSAAPSTEPSTGPSTEPSTGPSTEPSTAPSASQSPSGIPTKSLAPSTSPTESIVPSVAPTVSNAPSTSASPTTILIPLVDYGDLPPSDKIPMTLCEGDCDDDSDCLPGLVCLQRDAGDDIPGCQGDLSSDSDFCVKSDTLAPLVDYGDVPPEAFKPFRFCEGDCDDDSDCGKGLVCKQRDAGEVVPGCEGDFSSHSDFCVWP
jgi:hypothetical protein